MNILEIIKNLYTNKKCDWIIKMDESDIQPFVIQRWLAMNDHLRKQVRWLDKYVFQLSPKMYLSLAWSIIPKSSKQPFVKYIKQEDEKEEFSFILDKIRKHFNLSDNDFNANKDRLIQTIKKDMVNWFCFYGVPKKFWKQYYLNFNQIKEYGDDKKPKTQSLDAWGL